MPPTIRSVAIVPAAGLSRRMGWPKLLLPYGNSTVIETVLAAWQTSRVTDVMVVARRDDHDLIERLQSWPIELVLPEQDPPEMKDSVRAALRHARGSAPPPAAWFLAPADMPELSATVVDRLLDAFPGAEAQVVLPVHQGQRGHPILFRWELADAVEDLLPHEGVNVLRQRFPVCEVESGPECLAKDLDTPQDYRGSN